MDSELERAYLALHQKENAIKRQNEWVKSNRDRYSIVLPQGTKERIKKLTGMTINGYINKLIEADLDKREKELSK